MKHLTLQSDPEKSSFLNLADMARKSPVPDDELTANLGLYIPSKNLARLLFFNEIYKMILETHGVIMEFGVRWGQTLALMSALRGIYEPFNRHRRIVGFDTFEGLKGVSNWDGGAKNGDMSVPPGYEKELDGILSLHESLNPVGHLKKFEVVKGDVAETLPEYLGRHSETLVSLAVFDLDIKKPTEDALVYLRPRLFKGSVLVFDELCDPAFPGETAALAGEFDIKELRIRRFPWASRVSYAVLE